MNGADVSDLVPFVHVSDIERSIAFYERLGFDVQSTYKPGGRLVSVALENATARLMLAQATAPIDPDAQAVLFYLYARDLAALRKRLLAFGVSAGEIRNVAPGPEREMRVTDPDRYCLMIAEIDDQRVHFIPDEAERRMQRRPAQEGR
jgi:hypothetical protein